MKTEKTLSDVTRETSTTKANRFANSIMPVAPKSRTEAVKETPDEVVNQQSTEAVAQEEAKSPGSNENLTSVPLPPKPERTRKSGGFSVDDIVTASIAEAEVFNKMVRVTDEHHELLRLMAFQYRKPMNVIVHNLLALLNQAYQKEQKGGQNNV